MALGQEHLARGGQTVLITGAERAVGGYAVQLAKRRGAVVIASDVSPDGEFASKVAGADVYVPASQAGGLQGRVVLTVE